MRFWRCGPIWVWLQWAPPPRCIADVGASVWACPSATGAAICGTVWIRPRPVVPVGHHQAARVPFDRSAPACEAHPGIARPQTGPLEARAAIADRMIDDLAAAATRAVATRNRLLDCPNPSVSVSAARTILQGLVAIREHDELVVRIEALEGAQGSAAGHGRQT